MDHVVEMVAVGPRSTVVVAAATTWQEFPSLWKGLLDEVWSCLRAQGIDQGCRNVMLYRDGVPHVEIGVVRHGTTRVSGRVVASTLPAGTVAMTVHRGGYEGLGSAHQAVARWCAEHGRQPAGPRWEVYGPHRADPADLETEVYHLLV